MDDEGFEELSLQSSDFIREYVEQHKQELDELRAKATALAFQGSWLIIGDDQYPQKRLQYATTSFAEPEVSPRIILYARERTISRKQRACVTSSRWRLPCAPAATNTAATHRQENDEVFIGQKAFADADMWMFAYTFGDRVLEEVWPLLLRQSGKV
jgi:hypothetical protein